MVRAQRILADRDALRDEVGALRTGLSGRKRIGSVPTASGAGSLLTGPFCAAHPLVTVEAWRICSRWTSSGRWRTPRSTPASSICTGTSRRASRRERAAPPLGVVAPDGPAARRATELLRGLHGTAPFAVLAVPALRMALGTGVAGGVAALLHLERGYWAAISAAAVLHSVNLRITSQRAAQRALGTAAGLLLAFAALAAGVEPVVLAVLIVVLEFLLEYAVVRNYALAVVFVTPLALLLSDLAAPAPAGELVLDRVLGSVVGIVVALVCALLVVHDRAAIRVERALAGCEEAADRAERVLRNLAGPPPAYVPVRLALAVVELREADDAASGELWPAGIDPALLATTEQRAYRLLARLHRPRP